MLLSDAAIEYAIDGDPSRRRIRHEGDRVHPDAYAGLKVEPFVREHLNPASLDLTLSPVIRYINRYASPFPLDVADLPEEHTIRVDAREYGSYTASDEPWRIKADDWNGRNPGITLDPGAFLLMSTAEVVTLPDTLAARVEGKSSLGRLGLAVHITAGFIDPGFHGSITLEVANLAPVPITLRPGMRIAQIAFTPMAWPVRKSYAQTGHYQDQPAGEPVESRYRLRRLEPEEANS